MRLGSASSLKKNPLALQNNTWEEFRSAQYAQATVKNVEEYLQGKGEKLIARSLAPLLNGYYQEININLELNKAGTSYYLSLIRILRWIVELGSANICVEVSMIHLT